MTTLLNELNIREGIKLKLTYLNELNIRVSFKIQDYDIKFQLRTLLKELNIRQSNIIELKTF